MKLKYKLTIVELNGHITAVPVGKNASEFHGLLNINQSGKEILEFLEKETTIPEIVDKMCGIYSENDRPAITEAVVEFTDNLREHGMLEE